MAIKTSSENRINISRLTSLYKFKSEAVIARIAINYSLQLNRHFKLNEDSILDNEGKEYKDETLYGYLGDHPNKVIYKALVEQHYNKNLNESDFNRLIKLHLDDGLETLSKNLLDVNKGRNYHFDFLLNIVKNGVNLISGENISISKPNVKKEVSSFNGLLSFSIGKTKDGREIIIPINDLNHFDSHHIAIAGMTGSGKTELIKDILYQIKQNTNDQLKFIYFDYKGEGNADDLSSFLNATNTSFINVINGEYDLNPLSYINLSNENHKLANIKSFIDAVSTIATQLGVRQRHILQTVITDTFHSFKNGEYPSMTNIFEGIKEYYESRDEDPDTLYSIIEDMASFIFSLNQQSGERIYDRNIYLNLPQTLSDTLRQLCVFLTLNYILEEFNNTNDTRPDENKIKPLRYVVAIDEAHVYLKNKNARKKLENLLRIIRSKGVVIIMLSQGPEDYKTQDFDFVSQVKLPICLNINNKDIKLIKYFIGTPRSEIALKNSIDELEKGYGLINITEPEIIEINQFWQRKL